MATDQNRLQWGRGSERSASHTPGGEELER